MNDTNDLFASPIRRLLDAPAPELLPGRTTWESAFEGYLLVLDTVEFDFHVDVSPNAIASCTAPFLEHLRNVGFEPIPEDECPGELLENGWVRVYLVPIIPVADVALVPA